MKRNAVTANIAESCDSETARAGQSSASTFLRWLKQAALPFLLAAAFIYPAVAAELTTQRSPERGVTIDAIPQNLSAGASTWDFKIVLDTHSQELNDDLLKSTALLDGAGGRHTPTAWDGAGPGGHHREGILRFKPVSPQPPAIELIVMRPGESAPRSFRWQFQ